MQAQINQTKNGSYVIGVNGNLVTAFTNVPVSMNEVIYILLPKQKLKAEIIRIRGDEYDAQVFEDTKDIKYGNTIELTNEMLSIELGPGLLGKVLDGLGNPLEELAQKDGYFLQRGSYLPTLKDSDWYFTPVAKVKSILNPADCLGIVKEGIFEHRIMLPFSFQSKYKVIDIIPQKNIKLSEVIAQVEDLSTGEIHKIYPIQKWPIKTPITCYEKRLLPKKALTTKIRIVDTLFPIAEGGSACIPGPFGSGKTVFQQGVAKYAKADIVIIAACGERAGEVVETLKEFPHLIDPQTNRSLMERTIIICNTSSMPVASREASIYTAITLAEYYRQMGLKVLVLADSTSRWAQAIREMSARLEEIPAQEAYPAYLSSLIANFYERAGCVSLIDTHLGKSEGSLTLLGTVSPAGGNFEEPVTQATLSVVGCFLGLTYARSYAKRFPAIAPLESWSKYLVSLSDSLEQTYFIGFVAMIKKLISYYAQGQMIADQMKVVGLEDISLDEYIHYLKAEFFDAVFLQQDAFNEVDACPSEERVAELLKQVNQIIQHKFLVTNKNQAQDLFLQLVSTFKNMNLSVFCSAEYKSYQDKILSLMHSTNNSTLSESYSL